MRERKRRKTMQGRTIDFPLEQYARLLRAAQAEGRTFANLIRHIAALWLDRREPKTDDEEAA